MVSTRQMATSNGGGAGSGGGGNASATSAASADESARLSVVTRQTSSNYVMINCSTIATAPQRPSSSTSSMALVSSSSSTNTRQSLLTQSTKSNAGGASTSSNAATSIVAYNGTDSQLQLFDLPTEILTQIFKYGGYKKVGLLRVVSKSFNDVCMHILNSTFSKLITQTFNRFHAIKANMPRRESARRNHPLACECDIIETCYMRLSLLQMTFGKHIERGHCCFFPGAILDEVYTILHHIKNTPRLERPYRVTDELFDLSTMAMEYFRDRIESTLPDIAYFNKDFFKLPTSSKRPALVIASDLSDSSSSLPSPPQSNMVLRKGIRKIKQGMKIYNNQLSVLRSELRTCKRKSSEQGKQMGDQQKLLAEQQKQTLEYANRLDENDKKNEEMSRKFSTLLQELNKCKTELQYWRSKSPAIPTCTSCGQKIAAPMLPPEDYQALINQGVKPEDIILNLNDELDAETDAEMDGVDVGENITSGGNGGGSSCSQYNTNSSGNAEFVFPDETTTAKLLAINTATKNLKRQHVGGGTATVAATSSTSSMNTSNDSSNALMAAHCCGDSAKEEAQTADKPSQMTNCLDHHRGGNILRICAAPPSDLNIEATGSIGGGVGNGYSPKLFYGANVQRTGVIVNPLAAPSLSGGQLAPKTEIQSSSVATSLFAAAAADVDVSVAGVTGGGGGVVEDVASLRDLAATHETKKARRVQKATRCLNASGGSKRSK